MVDASTGGTDGNGLDGDELDGDGPDGDELDGDGPDGDGPDGETARGAPGEADRVLDAREIEGEPFGDIVAALESLGDGERLVLVNGFEPVPLYDVLEERGFAHETTRVGDDEWRVEIVHADAT